MGKIKGIFHKDGKDEPNEGNEDALNKLEGRERAPEERTSAETQEEYVTRSSLTDEPEEKHEEGPASKTAGLTVAEDAPVAGTVEDTKAMEPTPAPTSAPAPAPSVVPDPAPSTVAAEHSGPQIDTKTAPLADRIAPPAAALAPSTETTVTGPSTPKSPTKEKDSSKVSTWLKSKLSRRTSKAVPPSSESAKPTISEPKDPKVFVGGANLGAPDITSEPSGGSMREVALAGKQAGPVDAPVVSPESEPEQETVEAPMVSGALSSHPTQLQRDETTLSHKDEGADGDESSSISSLSSDEDTRGRSAIRLADQIAGNQQGAIFGSTAATTGVAHEHQHTDDYDEDVAAAADSTAGETPLVAKKFFPPANNPEAVKQAERESTSVDPSAASEEFEEARDHFDSAGPGSGSGLAPPDKQVLGRSVGEGRKSDSPARDSKFVENL